jgi:tetratricopeptide (TPR) repeat protein/actin-like ATPase involved in cell morphogenesis
MDGLAHLDFDVVFGRSGEGYQAQVTRSPAGDGQLVTFPRPFTDLELENLVLKLSRFRTRSRRAETVPVAAAKLAGGRLFETVFAGAVGDCLRRSLERADAQHAALRIRLRLSDCAELAELPWELLYDRADDWFFALSDRTPILRYVQMPDQPRPVHVTLPLRILVIRSEPSDCDPLDLSAEWAQVAAALTELTGAGLVTLTELAVPSLGELRRALMRDTFHVLHYMGHGRFNDTSGGVLLFTDKSGMSSPVSGADLGVMLHDHDSLRLAVLNACEAGRADPADPFAGVANALVRRGVPAVVAMQFEVSDQAACEFAPALYGALAAGRGVDAAVAEARKAIYTISPLEWATPVLYLRADNARLFDLSPRTPPAARTGIGPGPAASTSASRAGPGTGTAPDLLARETAAQAAARAAAERAAAHAERGTVLYAEGNYGAAAAAYRAAIALDPGLAATHTGLAGALSGLRRYAEAEAACRKAIRLDPALALAHANLAIALNYLERYSEAWAACQEAIRLDPALALAHASLGHALCGLERFAEAEAACREAIRLDPGLARAHKILGDALSDLSRWGEAEAAYSEAIRLDPAIALAHNNLGYVLCELERFAEAEAACREAIRLDPALALAHNNLGSALMYLKRYSEGEFFFREAIRLDPALALAHRNLGDALRDLSRLGEAEAAYREAIRLDPASAIAHNNLGGLLIDLKRYREAESFCREAIRLDPALSLAYSNLGNMLYGVKRYSEAEIAYRGGIRLDPASSNTHSNLGLTLSNMKRYGEAEAMCREAVRLDPANAHAHRSLAFALSGLKRFPEAKAARNEAARLDAAPKDTKAGDAGRGTVLTPHGQGSDTELPHNRPHEASPARIRVTASSAYGIHLGMTHSCIAVADDSGEIVVLKSALGEDTTPSVVYFESPDNVVVGRAAKDIALLAPDLVASIVQRHMGDAQVRWEFHGVQHSPESVSALILRELARAASEQTGQPVRDVVITVPAYFDTAEREATRRAAKMAGLDVLDVLAEPVAAALQYKTLNGADGTRHLLVYDLGGGTFDTTVIEMSGNDMHVICADGDYFLGGADWDRTIAEFLLESFAVRHPDIDPVEDEQGMQDLAATAEKVKKDLSYAQTRKVTVRFGGKAVPVELTRARLEDLTQPLLERTIDITERTIATAREKGVDRFDDLLLAGGMTRMPVVAATLHKRLGLNPRLDAPDLAAAKGAALFALAKQLQGSQLRGSTAWDPERYRLDVLSQARKSGRLPADLFVRYAFTEPPPDEKEFDHHIRQVVTEWKKLQVKPGWGRCIDSLLAEHARLAAAGDLTLAAFQVRRDEQRVAVVDVAGLQPAPSGTPPRTPRPASTAP